MKRSACTDCIDIRTYTYTCMYSGYKCKFSREFTLVQTQQTHSNDEIRQISLLSKHLRSKYTRNNHFQLNTQHGNYTVDTMLKITSTYGLPVVSDH